MRQLRRGQGGGHGLRGNGLGRARRNPRASDLREEAFGEGFSSLEQS